MLINAWVNYHEPTSKLVYVEKRGLQLISVNYDVPFDVYHVSNGWSVTSFSSIIVFVSDIPWVMCDGQQSEFITHICSMASWFTFFHRRTRECLTKLLYWIVLHYDENQSEKSVNFHDWIIKKASKMVVKSRHGGNLVQLELFPRIRDWIKPEIRDYSQSLSLWWEPKKKWIFTNLLKIASWMVKSKISLVKFSTFWWYSLTYHFKFNNQILWWIILNKVDQFGWNDYDGPLPDCISWCGYRISL